MSNIPVTQLVNPFVGLRSFEENEDYLFFGRGKQIDELLKKLNESHFLAVIGSSGSGKSSLVKSGLLPSVYSGFMKVGSNWRVALMQPGENPIGYLTASLAAEGILYNSIKDGDIPHEQIIEASLRRSENGLIQVYKDAHLSPDENLLIVVDQFEELFRFSKYEKENNFGKSDAMHFVRVLLTAAQQLEFPVYVLLTMRSDFLGDCAEFRGLPEAINKGQYLVPRMTREEIREAITGPVAVSTANISQRLVTRLLNDINNDTDQLPILQHAMMRTWEAWYQRKQPATLIDFEDYEKIGTMKSALSQHADEAYAELTTAGEQQVCELMFKALTDKAADSRGIRRPRSVADLCLLTGSTQEEVCKEVEIFRKPGRTFLMPHPDVPLTNDSIIDISHESLMRVWERLIKWTEEEGRSSDLYVRLVNSAELKSQGQRGLLKDPELAIALKWKAQNKPTAKWAEGYKGNFEGAIAYLEESQAKDIAEKKALAKLAEEKLNAEKQAAKRKLKNVITALMVFLLIGATLSTFTYRSISQEATDQRDSALVQKNSALSQKRRADSLAEIAFREKNKSDTSATVAKTARDSALVEKARADSLKLVALIAKDSADISAAIARVAKDTAEQRKIRAEFLKEEARRQGYKNAPSEYARLIREGPSTKREIQKDNFDYKLIAYSIHLDTLQSLIEATKDRKALDAYRNLKERLYYNNDLYEKIYASFETINDSKAKRSVFDRITYPAGFRDAPDANNALYKMVNDQLGNKVVAWVENKEDRRIICSTSDNWIYVYGPGKNSLTPENRIPMGAKVTALSYNSVKDIIYFGLESGDIGYIRYNNDNKNQPVFENALGSAVTAIQLFKQPVPGGSAFFLLAAAKKSKVVVYELDDNSLVPDKRLFGNTLPEKNLVEVTNAKFDEVLKTVIIKVRSLKTKKETIYSWNPFTGEVLGKYRQYKNDPDFEKKYLHPTNFYTKEQ